MVACGAGLWGPPLAKRRVLGGMQLEGRGGYMPVRLLSPMHRLSPITLIAEWSGAFTPSALWRLVFYDGRSEAISDALIVGWRPPPAPKRHFDCRSRALIGSGPIFEYGRKTLDTLVQGTGCRDRVWVDFVDRV
jgi:hypothetical protein